MRLSFWQRGAARRRPDFLTSSPFIIISSLLAALPARALNFTAAPAANLDFSQLGRVAITGDFAGISLFQFEEQTETLFSTNGSESLLARLPNGAFVSLANTDAAIQDMCEFTLSNGTTIGVVLGGNFTSMGGLESPAIAVFNPNTSTITPITGLSGQVNALLCDQDTNSVYVGGSFVGANSTNALAWVGGQGWTNLPFAGFNGPVTSITKASNGNIIFGGSFTGLGNTSTPSLPDGQVINLSTANITSAPATTTAGLSDPRNIICQTNDTDGTGSTWLLQDDAPGFWQATFGFGFRPTKLRLYNTHLDGRGTQTWRFTALPINGIMNFTYIDPATGANATCTSECPLSNNASVPFQDFHFVNVIGMNEFRLDISAWYGAGGGLDGIELFEDDIYAYAVNSFNEPTCANLAFGSNSSATGPWIVTPSLLSTAEYLTATLSEPITPSSAQVVFSPDIRQSGHYSVNIYTPGCLQDNTCATRGQFIISGQMTEVSNPNATINATLYQTNDFDKYDQVYFGQIDAASSSFRPQVTLTPAPNQALSDMTLVAQKISFTLINSTGGLTGLFEYDPSSDVVSTNNFTTSIYDELGANFTQGSAVNALATGGDVTYIGGNFSSSTAQNIVSINSQQATVQSLDGGLNGEVLAMVLNGTNLFVGGSFTNNRDNTSTGMNNVAVYDTSTNTWSPLGAGVDGSVVSVVLMTMNITDSTPEVVISVAGEFAQLEAFGNNSAVPATGFGIWVPSQGNWLQNLQLPVEFINGVLTSSILGVSNVGALYAGSLSSSSLRVNGAATLNGGLGRFPVDIALNQNSSSSSPLAGGVMDGVYDTSNGRNLTILAGQFTAVSGGETINNLVFIDGTNNDVVSGMGPGIADNSTYRSIAVTGNTLFVGGNITGTVNGEAVSGLISYDLSSKSFPTQPPSLGGGSASVSVVAVRPNTGDVYIGGDFSTAGSLLCPGVCFFGTSSSQWNQPGTNLEGTVNDMTWVSSNTLVAGGNLKANSTSSTFLATYDATNLKWDSYPGGDQLPGPVDTLTVGSSDGTQIWVAGTASNGSAYFMKYDGKNWNTPSVTLEPGSQVQSLQMFSLTIVHGTTPLLETNQALLLTGSLVLPNYGNASAALFNGTDFEPFTLAVNTGNQMGTVAGVFVEKRNFFTSSSGHLPLVFVVLIGLGISLALMLLIVVAGLFLDRLRKQREGYIPAPTSMYDRGTGIQRVPPQELLEGMNVGRPMGGPPQV